MNSVATSSSTLIRIGKRKNESFSEELESPTKKLCTVSNNWYFVLASESEIDTDEGTESICSLQNKSTDWAKDTSDTSSKSGWSSDPGFEYEVASLSDDEHPNPFTQFNQDSYSSGTDTELVCSVTLTVDHGDDNDDSWADSSSISSDMDDPELSRADFWTCVKCKAQNNNPMFRYCEKCFKVRKNFFPPRPRRKNRKPRQNRPRKRKSNSSDTVVGMSKVRKQDDMSDVTSASTSTDRPSSSRTSYNVLDNCSSYETKREQYSRPGTHSESDSLSSSQETILMCSKSMSSSQETIVPYDYLQQNTKQELSLTVKTPTERGSVTLSAVEHTESTCNVDKEKTDCSRVENPDNLSCTVIGNLSIETVIARSESQSCELRTTDQGTSKHSSEVENITYAKAEESKEAENSGSKFSQNSENLLSQETTSTSCCDSGGGSSSSKVCDCGETLSQETAILSQESVMTSQEFVTSQGSTTSGIATSSFESLSQGVSDNSVCSTCMVNPKNGAFVHGKSAHIYCCYKCSLKIWMQTGRCPICNAKVRQVLKAVVV